METSFLIRPPSWQYLVFLSIFCFFVALLGLFNSKTILEKKSIFISSLCSFIVFSRWPVLFYRHELNPDESVLLAQAMKFTRDIVPWRSVDSTTSGPLNSYALLIPKLFGFSLTDYYGARVLGLFCTLAMLILTFYTLALLTDTLVAKISVLPLSIFLACCDSPDFIHYSTELVPILVISLSCYLGVWFTKKPSSSSIAAAGLLLGALPFTKLQAVPIGAFLFITLFVYCVIHKGLRKYLALFSATLCVVPILILGLVLSGGALFDFWQSYIVGTLHDVRPSLSFSIFLFGFVSFFQAFQLWFLLGIGNLLMCCVLLAVQRKFRNWVTLALSVLYIFVAYFCVIRPGKFAGHYLQFTLQPLTLAGGVSLFSLKQIKRRDFLPHLVGYSYLLLAISISYQAVDWLAHSRVFSVRPQPDLAQSTIPKYVSPNETMAIWGFSADLYMRSKTYMSTRDATSVFPMTEASSSHYYRNRYLNDLKKNPPKIFIEAISPDLFAYESIRNYPLSSAPEIYNWINTHYLQVYPKEQIGTDATWKIYIRKTDPMT